MNTTRTLTGLREDLEVAESEADLASDAKWTASEALRKAPTPENRVAFERAEHAWEVACEIYRQAMREWSNACQKVTP